MLKLLCLLLFSAATLAAEDSGRQIKRLDQNVQSLKKDILELSSEIDRIEQQLLYPSDTKINVFLSVTGKVSFTLESARLEIDGETVASHVYSPAEVSALFNGGVQRFYTGNVITGEHQMMMHVIGLDHSGSAFTRDSNYLLNKSADAGFVEINISAPETGKPALQFRDH